MPPGVCSWGDLGDDDEFDAAVVLAACRGEVGSERDVGPEALCLEPGGIDSLRHQEFFDRVRARLRQLAVPLGLADAVGVTLDRQLLDLGVLAQNPGDL